MTDSRLQADSRALGRFRAIPGHAFEGGRMPLSTPRTCILERAFENNEELRTAVSLRCQDAVLGMQNPSCVVLSFVCAVIHFVVVLYVILAVVTVVVVVVILTVAIVCCAEMYYRNLVASRMNMS